MSTRFEMCSQYCYLLRGRNKGFLPSREKKYSFMKNREKSEAATRESLYLRGKYCSTYIVISSNFYRNVCQYSRDLHGRFSTRLGSSD